MAAKWLVRTRIVGSRKGACRPTGIEEPGKGTIGVLQEFGRPCCFHVNLPEERPDDQLPAPHYRDRYLYVTGQNDECLLILHLISDHIIGLLE